MPMNPEFKLTKRQQEILDLIKHSIVKTGAPPTRAEIATAFGFRSPNASEDHLQALARKGVIELIGNTSRGIRLQPQVFSNTTAIDFNSGDLNSKTIPLIGRVAAGAPIFTEEHIEKTLTIQSTLFIQQPDYLLKVRGMSMKDVGIMEGDLLAVKATHKANNGQIVVARIDGEVTVKRFHQGINKIELQPENPDFSTIVVTAQNEFALEGIAVGLIRDMRFH